MPSEYNGLAAFGEDEGTLWMEPGSQPLPLGELQKTNKSWLKALKKRLRKRPLIWFVDDECANRNWFVENHRLHFALLTLSSRQHVAAALQAGTFCDAVVTDIFFPAKLPTNNEQAGRLLRIYDEILASPVSDLPRVWASWRNEWSLDGFDIARDVFDYAARRKECIPVLLFSRKATLLLGTGDWFMNPSSAVENTHWMLEKLDPSETGESARRAASIQRDRINAVLRYRQQSAQWWKKLLGRLSIGWGPVRYSLR
jgi:hypothetical protein